MNSLANNNRMLWVDSMRGFSMLIVVFGHVLLSLGIGGYSSFLSSVLLTFRMPLFFFVSGFFSFRIIAWWNKRRIADILKRKLQAQVLCTLVFLVVYQYVTSGGVNIDHGFGGYWFTIVLFQMYLSYMILSLISRLIKINLVIPAMLLFSALGVAALVLYSRDSKIWEFLCWENLCKYYQFFTFGIICARYKAQFFKLFRDNSFIAFMIIGWVVCMIIWYNNVFFQAYPLAYSFIHDIIVRYFALLTVISLFYGYRDYFSGNMRTSRILRFIGQRTLDIYMIHYFFLPDLTFLSTWLQDGNRIIIQILIASIITAAIVSVCMMISAVLRKSTVLETWLFGVKPKIAKVL